MEPPAEAYESYDAFVKTAIKRYWDAEHDSRVDLIAMLLATGGAWNAAWDDATSKEKRGKVLTGAAGAAAVTMLLRTVLGGPVGVLLAGASIASLVALYSKHHERIWNQVSHYRAVVDKYQPLFGSIQADLAGEKINRDQRNLMLDGLMMRLLAELDDVPDLEDAREDD